MPTHAKQPWGQGIEELHSASRGQMSTVRKAAKCLERGKGRWPVWAPAECCFPAFETLAGVSPCKMHKSFSIGNLRQENQSTNALLELRQHQRVLGLSPCMRCNSGSKCTIHSLLEIFAKWESTDAQCSAFRLCGATLERTQARPYSGYIRNQLRRARKGFGFRLGLGSLPVYALWHWLTTCLTLSSLLRRGSEFCAQRNTYTCTCAA